MYDRLKDIFDNVNEWLKFAEAKHAGLIVLNSGVVFGILSVYKDYQPTIPTWIVLTTFLFIGISLIYSFASLFPRTDRKIENGKKPKKTNLYFAGDLSQFNKDGLKKELIKQFGQQHEFDGLEDDLVQQVIVNSFIATRKYRLFKGALIFTIIGLSVPAIFVCLKLVWLF